jgi:hypothetical protein
VQVLHRTIATAAGTALVLFARPAEPAPVPAQPVVDSVEGVTGELAGEAAYVTAPIRGGTNPFGAGFGVRAGLVWGGGWYIGAAFAFFLGGKDVDVSYRALFYGLDFGYGFRFRAFGGSSLTLRPRVGVGDAAVYYTDPSLAADVVTSASGGTSAASDTLTVNNLYLQPALTAMLDAGGHFMAADASMIVLPGIAYGGADATTWLSYGLQGELGFRF